MERACPSHLPSEEVTHYPQPVGNHFPELELAAQDLAARARLTSDDLYAGLVRYLDQHLGSASSRCATA